VDHLVHAVHQGGAGRVAINHAAYALGGVGGSRLAVFRNHHGAAAGRLDPVHKVSHVRFQGRGEDNNRRAVGVHCQDHPRHVTALRGYPEVLFAGQHLRDARPEDRLIVTQNNLIHSASL
jgi:hypothetical protein